MSGPRVRWLAAIAALLVALIGAILLVTRSHTDPYQAVNPSPDPEDRGEGAPLAVQRLLLIGDAGSPSPPPALFELLSARAGRMPETTQVVFLGDNDYPDGFARRTCCSEPVPALDAQIGALLKSGARGLFIPGNHDWSGVDGDLGSLEREASYIAVHSGGLAELLPRGLEAVRPIASGPPASLLLLDTNWWLGERSAPELDDADRHVAALLGELGQRGDVVVAGHHPLVTHGPHGGHFDLEEFLWPVPLLRPIWRWLGGNQQDLTSPSYHGMVARLRNAMSARPPLAFAAGHDHSLQVLQPAADSFVSLVSGAGSLPEPVWHGDDTVFALEAYGFMEVDFFADSSVFLRVFAAQHHDERPVAIFTEWLRRGAGRGGRPE